MLDTVSKGYVGNGTFLQQNLLQQSNKILRFLTGSAD